MCRLNASHPLTADDNVQRVPAPLKSLLFSASSFNLFSVPWKNSWQKKKRGTGIPNAKLPGTGPATNADTTGGKKEERFEKFEKLLAKTPQTYASSRLPRKR